METKNKNWVKDGKKYTYRLRGQKKGHWRFPSKINEKNSQLTKGIKRTKYI